MLAWRLEHPLFQTSIIMVIPVNLSIAVSGVQQVTAAHVTVASLRQFLMINWLWS